MSNRDHEIQILYVYSRFCCEAVKTTKSLDPTNSRNSRISPNTLKRRLRANGKRLTQNVRSKPRSRHRRYNFSKKVALLKWNLSHSAFWYLSSSLFSTEPLIWPPKGLYGLRRSFGFFRPCWPLLGKVCYGVRCHPVRLEASAMENRRKPNDQSLHWPVYSVVHTGKTILRNPHC